MGKTKEATVNNQAVETVRIDTINGIGIFVTADVAAALAHPIIRQQINVAARSRWIATVTTSKGETKAKDTNVLADYASVCLANGKAHAVLPDGSAASWEAALTAAGLDSPSAARRAERYTRSITQGAIVAFLARAMRAYASKS
jgi:hypothetical protein